MSDLNSKLMKELAEECADRHIALITPETAKLISLLINSGQCRNALEIGTGLGYSTIVIARSVEKRGGSVVTVERLPDRIERARQYFMQSGLNNIRSIVGEAHQVLPLLDEVFDFIFMDAAMGQYLDFFNMLYPKLAPGGLFVADNVFLENLVFRGRLEVPRRRRTMQQRLQAFLHGVSSHPQLTTWQVPFGDGLTVSWRHPE